MLLAAVKNAAADMAVGSDDEPLSVEERKVELAIVRSAARIAAWASTSREVFREEKRPRDGVLEADGASAAASPEEGLAVEAGETREGAGASIREEVEKSGDAKLEVVVEFPSAARTPPPAGVISPPERREIRGATDDETVGAETAEDELRSPMGDGVLLVVAEVGVTESKSETGTVTEVRALSTC